MAFGELVAQLRADLTQYERDLNRAEQLYRAFLQRLPKASVGGGSAAGGSGGGGAFGPAHVGASNPISRNAAEADAAERRFRKQMDAAERDLRRFYATWDRSVQENQEKQSRASREEAAGRQRNLRQVMVLQRELAADDARRIREENSQNRASAAERVADLRTVQRLKKELDRQDSEEEKRRIAEARGEAEARINDLKQVAAFQRYLAEEEIKEAKRVAAAQKATQEEAQRFFRQQVGSHVGSGGIASGGPGAFLQPEHLRGLDQANAKWLQQQQEIAKAGSLADRLGKRFDDIGQRNLTQIVEGTKQFVSTLALVGGGALVAGFVGLVKHAIDLNSQYQIGKIALAETLALTTDLVDKQGRVVSGSKAMTANFMAAGKILEQVRTESFKTALTFQQLSELTTQTLGFAISGGLNARQAVPVIAQVANLAKAMGARDEREQGFEVRALLTGQNVTRSRIGRALGLSRAEITEARDSGKLLEFLNKILSSGKPYLDEYKKSWEGLISTFITKGENFLRLGFEKVFDRIRTRLEKLNNAFQSKDIQKWADAFSTYAVKAFDAIENFFQSDAFKNAFNFFKYLVEHGKQIAEVFIAIKALQGLSAVSALLRNQNRPGALLAGSAVGGALETAGGFGIRKAADAGSKFFKSQRARFAAAGVEGVEAAGGAEAGAALLAGVGPLIAASLPILLTSLAVIIPAVMIAVARHQQNSAEEQRIATEHDTSAMLRRGSPLVAEQFRAREVRAAAEARFREMSASGSTAGLSRQAQTVINAREREARAGAAIEEKIQRDSLQKQLADAQKAGYERLERRAKAHAAAAELAKKERLFAAKMERELADDEIQKINDVAEVRKQEVAKNITNMQLRNRLLKEIEAKRVEDVKDAREKERIAVQRQMAQLLGDKKAEMRAEYAETLRAIEQEKHSDADAAKLRVAARYDYLKKVRDQNSEEKLTRQKFVAEVTGNEKLSIINAANQEYKDRKSFLEGTVADQKRLAREVGQVRVAETAVQNRKLGELQTRLNREGMDLVRESAEFQKKTHQQRLSMEKDVLEAQKRLGKESRDIMRERIDAERELGRVQTDRARRLQEIGTGAGRIGSRVLLGGPRGGALVSPTNRFAQGALGFSGVLSGIQDEAGDLFQQHGLGTSLQKAFFQQTGNRQLAAAMAQSQLREFRGQAGVQGGTESVLGRLGELGINAPAGLQKGLQGLEAKGIETTNLKEDAARKNELDDVQREREDAQKAVDDAQRHLTELDERQSEVFQSYKDTIQNLHETFNVQLQETASALAKLAEESNKVAHDFRSNQEPLPSNTIPVIRKFAPFAPGAAQTQADKLLGETHSFVFNDGAIQIQATGDPQKLLEDISKAALDLSRRTAPSRK